VIVCWIVGLLAVALFAVALRLLGAAHRVGCAVATVRAGWAAMRDPSLGEHEREQRVRSMSLAAIGHACVAVVRVAAALVVPLVAVWGCIVLDVVDEASLLELFGSWAFAVAAALPVVVGLRSAKRRPA
jgi:hypothetical protein